jgi:hypothetical protein
VNGRLDPDTMLSVADLEAWESRHGRIPDEAIVIMRQGDQIWRIVAIWGDFFTF